MDFCNKSFIEDSDISTAIRFFNRNEIETDKKVLACLWSFVQKASSLRDEFSNYSKLERAAQNYNSFTKKQRKAIKDKKVGTRRESKTWYPFYDGPDDLDRYLGGGEWDHGVDVGYYE